MKSIKPILLIFLILQACHEDEPPAINPQEFIIGKWETIEVGNWPTMRPTESSGFTEFTADSIARFFDYSVNAYVNQSLYWLTDSLLVEAYYREDGQQVLFKYQYEFERNWLKGDRLRLDIVEMTSINRTGILIRIE